MAKGRNFKRPPNKSSKRIQVKEVEPPIDYNLQKPIFSFKYMAYQEPGCISMCQRDKKSLIIDTFLRFSQLTWKQIVSLPRQAGFEKIPFHRFRVSLPKKLTPEVTLLVARYDGDGGRLAGFRDKDIYHVVLVGKDLYSH